MRYEGMLYVIEAKIEARGVVEVQDVTGTLYSETRGLLPRGETLDGLREAGLVGAVNVDVESEKGVTTGRVLVHTRLPPRETAELAAALETIRKIGPCEAEVEIDEIRLTRRAKSMIRSGELHAELLEKIREVEAS